MAHKRGAERNEREVFLSELARHGSIRKACLVSGTTRSWLRIQMSDSDFAQAYHDALEDSVDRIEEAGNAGARDGDEKLIRYFLDAKRYKKQAEGPAVSVQPSVTITIGG